MIVRSIAAAILLLWQSAPADRPIADPTHMRYMRALRTDAPTGQACAVLDAAVYPHAAASLNDLRLFPAETGAHEVPYAITLSEGLTPDTQPARVLNLGMEGARIVFDLEMPRRAYTSVTLALDPALHDFIATADVSGTETPGGTGRSLGTFTLFDLTSQHLSRDTTLPLEESTFPYLHVALTITPTAGHATPAARVPPTVVQGAEVPPSREAQVLYTTVAETRSISTANRESRAQFELPVRVPVERVAFVLAPGFTGNFSRDVRVTATAEPGKKDVTGADNDTRSSYPETVDGSILRVHTSEGGHEIRTEQLAIPAVLGANLQSPARVEVAIENGDDQPLPIVAVRLEMRQRKLCFEASGASASGALHLYYGDAKLDAPVYDYARLFSAAANAAVAQLGPEQLNPAYQPSADTLSFTDRHPEALWIALIAAICVLGGVAVRASRRLPH